jgi:hypothetical protein
MSGSVDRSVASILSELRNLVDELALTRDVLRSVLPGGQPHSFESQLWDYKEKLPVIPEKPTEEEKTRYKAELGELTKDVVAFHNAYGGYILFGITDKGRNRVCGCSTEFDCGDFNRRLQSYTRPCIAVSDPKTLTVSDDVAPELSGQHVAPVRWIWDEWITSVDHKRIGVMYILLGLVMLLRGFIDEIMMRSQQALAFRAAGDLPPEHYD